MKNTFSITLTILVILLSNRLSAQVYIWAKEFYGGDNIVNATCLDGSSNLYVTGNFQGTVDFDPGPGTATISSNGGDDIYVAKYDNGGGYLWVRRIGGVGIDRSTSIKLDPSGNPVITGFFVGNVNIDSGSGTVPLTSTGFADGLTLKYDNNGNYIWSFAVGKINFNEVNSVAIDNSGNIVITGNFEGTVDFDPGSATFPLSSSGGKDIFLAKYDSNSNFIWAKKIGSAGWDSGVLVDLDMLGNIYVSGQYVNTVDFDPQPGTFNLTAEGQLDVFLAKYDNACNLTWAISLGGTDQDVSYALKVDPAGNSYLTGYFYSTADFDPGSNTATLTSNGDGDIFLAKYDNSGNYLWANQMGSSFYDCGKALELDGQGSLYITGEFQGTVDFDPGSSISNQVSQGGYEFFLAKYDLQGNYQTSLSLGGTGTDGAYSLQFNSVGNLYISGCFQGNVDFDPGPNSASLFGAGNFNSFIAKYKTGIDELGENQKNKPALHVSPNPFKDYTSLSVELKAQSFVQITLVNSLGQNLQTIEEKVLMDGKYTYQITVENKGIYYIRSIFGHSQKALKIIRE
jgi:hypothetical protein